MSLQKINSTRSIKGIHNSLRAIDLTQIKDSERFSEAVCIRVGKILNLGVEYTYEVQQIGLAMLPSLRAIYSARKYKRNPLDTFGILSDATFNKDNSSFKLTIPVGKLPSMARIKFTDLGYTVKSVAGIVSITKQETEPVKAPAILVKKLPDNAKTKKTTAKVTKTKSKTSSKTVKKTPTTKVVTKVESIPDSPEKMTKAQKNKRLADIEKLIEARRLEGVALLAEIQSLHRSLIA